MSLLEVDKQKIEDFLDKNKRRLSDPEYYFGVDNNQDPVENFTEDRLKILCCFLSPGKNRAVSNTFNALNYLAHAELGDKVFVDCCYFPDEPNMGILQKSGIPYIFGNVSHEPVTSYDLVFISCAVMPEVLNVSHYLEYSGIPLTIQQREKDDRLPFIVFGGAAANEAAIVLGPVKRDGELIGNSLIDIANYGYGEVNLTKIVNKFYEIKTETGTCKNKSVVKERLISEEFMKDFLFYPDKYEWVYAEDNFTIKEIKKLDDRLPDRVEYNKIHSSDFRGFPLKTFNLTGENADSHDIMISSGCSGQSSCCSFCMEANVAGYYWERELSDIEKDMAYVRKTAAPNTISWFSFNLNYYKHFMDLLGVSADYFKGVTLLNERMDVVANAPQQLELAKRLGLKRFSGAIEGMGERVRNGIFNKNLPRKTLMDACRVIYSLRLMHMKNGMITCGQENEDDIQDFISEIDEMLAIRDEMGANTSLQFNVTPLVLYSQIPLRWLPRITAKNSFLGVRNMQTLIKACQERSIRIKFNGRGCGTWLEQLILDFGPIGTDWMVATTLDQGMMYVRNFGDKDKTRAVTELEKRGYDPLFFVEERPENWIFPNDHIKYAEDKLIKMWYERHKNMNFDTQLCLKTPANSHPKCYNCGACKTPEEKKRMVARELKDEMSLDEVIERLSDSRHVDTVRVVAKMNSEWDIYNRESLCHYLTAQFLQESEEIERAFYAVGKTSTTWLSNNGQKGWFGGNFAWDIQLKERIPLGEFERSIEGINQRLKSCKIVRVFGDSKELPIKRESVISFIGQTSQYSMSQLKDKLANFDWDIKVAVKSMGGQLDTETKHMPELKERVLFVPKGNTILIYCSLPASVNPYLVMSSILGKGYEKMLDEFRFNIVDQGIETDSTCKCGKHLLYSQIEGKQKLRCPVCEGKLYLAKLSGRI